MALLDKNSFETIRDIEFRPEFKLIGLKYLRDKAGRERDLRELYRGRAPYELLQNADDAGAKRAFFILHEDGLAFVHDGKWFTLNNFRSLADGWSDKDPKECIGHKGLGFRSVLDITPSPYLIRLGTRDFFAVKFAWSLNHGHIQETLKRDPGSKAEYERWKRTGQSVCPVMAIPGLAKKSNLGGGGIILDQLDGNKYGASLTTMFWFPQNDPDITNQALSSLSPTPMTAKTDGRKVLLQFFNNEVSVLLPFLSSIREVFLYEMMRRITSVRILEKDGAVQKNELHLRVEADGKSRNRSFFHMHFGIVIPPFIRNQPDTPLAVKQMEKVKVVLSVRLEGGKPAYRDESKFHVYFPTEEGTGTGFVVHGDFFVKPDRTRLMGGKYNEWLLACAAQKAANDFLTELLKRYPPASVFEALSPQPYPATENSKDFVSLFSNELQKRDAPFVPTRIGLLRREEVILPPKVDEEGFWESEFSENLCSVVGGKRAFLAHRDDSKKVREFMRLAEVAVLEPEKLLDFIGVASKSPKPPEWWYKCYTYMVEDDCLSRKSHEFFSGRKLIPTGSSVLKVPSEENIVVCLMPKADYSSLAVPKLFSSIFAFLDQGLSELLEDGGDYVLHWVLDRFHIARFQATELLPKAIRHCASRILSGSDPVNATDLRKVWIFIKKVTKLARTTIISLDFWRDVGRFPFPIRECLSPSSCEPIDFAPAFLTYLPDPYLKPGSCLLGVEGLRRVDAHFLTEAIKESKDSRNEWLDFLKMVGVDSMPKLLEYGRVVTKGQDLPLSSDGPKSVQSSGFTGERQLDENKAVSEVIANEGFWEDLIENLPSCGHENVKDLRSLTLIEGLGPCSELASQEYRSGNDDWSKRLWNQIRSLPIDSLLSIGEDSLYCRGGSVGGHTSSIGSYLRRQLETYAWLPSSQGPVTGSGCFSRLHNRRLISKGRLDFELGDFLLPYVVAESLDTCSRLEHFEIKMLDDAESASPETLWRAVALIGERLSMDWGIENILQVPSRWRLVRGAIQEIYHALNRAGFQTTSKVRLAARIDGKISFIQPPLYYAEPGSSLEQAFKGVLPLLDADRPYPQLFAAAGVTELIPGKTVHEQFLSEQTSSSNLHLYRDIKELLAPLFLAAVIVRSERPRNVDLVLRRLEERFTVKTCSSLSVSFSLADKPAVNQVVEFPKFYLMRSVVPGAGAIQEAHYTLYATGRSASSFYDLEIDADALGEAIAPIFLDGITDEIAALFPRIASRFQTLRGDTNSMEDYMFHQLGISREAQEMARALCSGEYTEGSFSVPPPPPPAHLIIPKSGLPRGEGTSLTQTLHKHHIDLNKKTENLINAVARRTVNESAAPPKSSEITPQQEVRGTMGEEEILRRLNLPGGWEGFVLFSDDRKSRCGYDFLCKQQENQVKFEIKTFLANGHVYLTVRELQQASASGASYYLVGVLDDGGPAQDWKTFIIRNPLEHLLHHGKFDYEARLEAAAAELFNLTNAAERQEPARVSN
jgi:hypothetical protein